MQENEYWSEKLSREQNHLDYEHQSKMNTFVQIEEMNLFSLLKPKVSIDGNQWRVLYGENLQDGVAGFGYTLMEAIYDFNKSFHAPIAKSVKL